MEVQSFAQSLPVKSTKRDRPSNQRAIPPEQATAGRVLIVEDQSELVEVLEYNLERNGFEVLIARDGLEACRVIGRDKPELILLDLMLPLLDGWEICRMVRSHHDPQLAKIPIIMLSALGAVEDRIKGYDLGADLYLPKPYAIKEVILKTRQLISQHQEYLELSRQMDSMQHWSSLQDQWQQALFHELRNQLTVISGMALHLRQEKGLPQDRSKRFAEQISNSSYYLGTLAENFLLVRQVEQDPRKLQAERIVLVDLLNELQALFAPLAEEKSCSFQIDCPQNLRLELHPIGLKIILSSLLDNALKYSTLDGQVVLKVEQADGELKILIEDDGPGIPAEEQDKVFDKFYRGNASQNRALGTGLGLYMARTLAEAMGGSLKLNAAKEAGCCFVLQFPLTS